MPLPALSHNDHGYYQRAGYGLRQVLPHNALSASSLFDGHIPAHTNKVILVGEIEMKLGITRWSQKSIIATHVVIIRMLFIERHFQLAVRDALHHSMGAYSVICGNVAAYLIPL